MHDIIITINHAIAGEYESNSIEFKKCSTDCPALYETLSSFSNQDCGGCIVLEIDEKQGFKPVIIQDIQKCISQVQHQCSVMEPEVRASVEVVDYEHAKLICISVPGLPLAQRPCYIRKNGVYNGAYIRVGDGDIRMSATEVHSYLNFKQQTSDDSQSCGTLSEMDNVALKSFLLQLAETHPKLYSLGEEKVNSLLHICKNDVPTLAGQLMFGIYPQQYLPCAVINATRSQGVDYAVESIDGQRFIDSQRIDGNIKDILATTLQFVRRNTRLATVIDPITTLRADKPEYPEIAVRELILNALLHRDYSQYTRGEAVSLNIFADRLEITSPGGIFGGYSLKSIETQQVRSLRNPILANLVEMSNLTENRGTGLVVAERAMLARNLPVPKYEIINNHFKATLYNSNQITVTEYTSVFPK